MNVFGCLLISKHNPLAKSLGVNPFLFSWNLPTFASSYVTAFYSIKNRKELYELVSSHTVSYKDN